MFLLFLFQNKNGDPSESPFHVPGKTGQAIALIAADRRLL